MKNNSVNLMSRKKAILIYIMVSLFLAFEMAVQVSPSVMASDLMHSLSIGAFSLGIMSSVYFYSYTSMQIPSGLLFDRFSARTILVFAVMICSVGSILFGCITSFYFGCLARLLMGIGSAFAFVSVLVMASRLFNSKWFPILTGITQMLAALGAMSGQLPIRLLINDFGWRDTMYILGAIGIALAFILACLLNNSEHKSSREVSQYDNEFTSIKSSLKLIVVNPQSWLIAIYACLLWAPMSGFASLWGVSFLEKFDGLSVNSAALYCSMMWLGLAVGSPLLGVFATLINKKTIPLTLSALVGIISFGFALYFHMHGATLILCLFFSGAACSGQALSFRLVKENNPQQIRGVAIAFNNMAVVISGVIFQPLIGWLLRTTDINGLVNIQFSLSVILIAYAASFFIALFLIRDTIEKSFETPKSIDNDKQPMNYKITNSAGISL